jgi:glycosyltransferase involved in cell wall biosynthesis
MRTDSAPNATVVITTKNRRDDLRRAIASAIRQDIPLEILVIDDGSTDGTAEMVRSDFRQARVVRSEQSRGLIVQRTEAAKLATTPVIVSIDDDAEFSMPHVVSQALDDLDHPQVGAVAIPYINDRQDQILRHRAPDDAEVYVTDSFTGTAHALRRDVFLRLGGYRAALFHQGEERDYCVRLLEAGFFTRLGRSDPILHHESPRRDLRRMDLYGRRNDVLFAWHNVPAAALVPQLLGTTARGLAFGARIGRPLRMAHGLALGYGACVRQWRNRRPVSPTTYRLFRELRRRGIVRLTEVAASPSIAPALANVSQS